MYTVGLDIDTRAGAERLGQWISIWSVKNFIGRRKIVEACHWIIEYKIITKNRNDSSPLCQGALFEALSLLPFFCLSNPMLEVKISNRLTCVTTISGPANAVCLIDSGIFSRRRYYVFININPPLYSTPVRMSSFFNRCSKKKPNCFKDDIRGFSSDFSSYKNKDRSVVSISSKECSSKVPSRKADMSLPTVQNILTKPSNNHVEGSTYVVDSLRQLKPEKDGIYTHITTRFLANPEFLKLAYARIKNKEDNLTSGGNHFTLDGISQKWFENTALRLKNGTYEFSPSRRINIPKKGSLKLRPLTMGNPRDKIIQKAIQLILEEIYENKEKSFSDASHGFRPNKSCHTALQQVKEKWTAIPWFISIDIKDAFGTINRNILISRIKLKIRDQRLFEIILKMLKANIISFTGILNESYGVPQGNVLSPILANIYFHDLDVYIEKEIIGRYKKGTKATKCLDYQRAIAFTNEEKKASLQKRKQIARRKRRDAHKAGLRYTKIDGNFIRIKYVRYADDFLIGVRGPKTLVQKILRSVVFFLKSSLQLHLNEEKSKCIDSFSNKISFLGMLIHNVATKNLPYRRSRALQNKKRKLNRVLLRAQNLENQRTKRLKDECLKLLRNSYKTHREDRKPFKENFISVVKNSPTFGDVIKNSNRAIYQEFVQNLLLVSDIKENQTIKNFLNLWEEELSLEAENSKNKNSFTRPITKSETIRRIVEILKTQHNLPAQEVEWFQLFRGVHKARGSKWKPVWINNFSLSENTVSKLKLPKNNIYHAKYNVENIRLAIEDLLLQAEQPTSKDFVDYIPNNNAISVRQTWDEEGVFSSLPPQINANTSEIYKRLEEASIINNKKKPMSKNSLLSAESWLIISYYNNTAHGLLSYFRCADNLNTVKKIVTYHLRYSLLHTLAHKHKCSIKKILEMYGKEIKANGRQNKVVSFINSIAVTNLKKDFLSKDLRNPYSELTKSYMSLQRAAISANECAVKNCNEIDNIEVHHVRKLFRNIDKTGKVIVQGKAKKLSGRLVIESALKRKQIPFCPKHHKDWHKGVISNIDLDEPWV
jgi:group II intron reverse transcriptase/maturase